MNVLSFIGGAAGTAVGGPGVGTALGSSAASAVSGVVNHLIGSVVGVFDPGKARDAQREQRAEMWYQLAILGSTYAGQHVLGGRTLVYTVKEKGYYEDRWNKLLSANPYIAQQAQILGGVGIPDNPTDAEKTQMAQEIDAYNNRDIYATQTGQGVSLVGRAATASFTPSGTGLPPINPLSPQAQANVHQLPTVVTTAQAPVTHMWLYILGGVLLLGVVFVALHERK